MTPPRRPEAEETGAGTKAKQRSFGFETEAVEGQMCPELSGSVWPARARLTSRFAQRKAPPSATEQEVADAELPGFCLRIQPGGGTRSWCVRYRQRGKHRRKTLGSIAELRAEVARAEAKNILAAVALDGLPEKPAAREGVLFSDFVAEFWRDYSRHWKASTETRNRRAWELHLLPEFGSRQLGEITRADVLRWRDGMQDAQGTFNRSLPVLAVMFGHAEKLGLRTMGSNPCKRVPRYKRELPERFLSAAEFRRLGQALRDAEADHPLEVAAIRLLIYTGARLREITELRWEWVQPPRLLLPDSKTGPKIVYLNSQAVAVLSSLAREEGRSHLFRRSGAAGSIRVDNFWLQFRRRCLLPDVRLHDLRHTFASVAIMNGVPLATIGKLLGHALPETTARYAHLADESVAQAAQRVSGRLASHLGLSR